MLIRFPETRTILSDGNIGSGPEFVRAVGDHLEANGNLVVTDNERDAVIRVLTATGNRIFVTF